MVEAAMLLCAKCKWWTAYKSTRGGVNRIDTICRVCGARLRHTHRPRAYSTFQGIKLAYGPIGKGGYQRYRSVLNCIIVNPNKVMRLVSTRNKKIQRLQAEKDGIILPDEPRGEENDESKS